MKLPKTRLMLVAVGTPLAAAATVGCYSQQYPGNGDSGACEPVESSLAASVQTDGLAGEYRLVVIATEGERAGESATGTLRLTPMPEDQRAFLDPSAGGGPREGVSVPLYGIASLDVGAVGGVIAGDLASDDPQRPGVLVVEERAEADGAPRIYVRLGSEGNDRGRQRFDGAYFALSVAGVEAGAMFGSWTSGLETMQSSGHFCAYR